MKCAIQSSHALHFVLYVLVVPDADADNGASHLPALEGPYPSHKLQQSAAVPYIGDDIVDSEWTCHVV